MADDTADLVVVGAGAAGLWAAGVAARGGLDVLLLEKTPRTGTKILASGGTRCNLTTTLGPAAAARLFRRRGERFLRPSFEALPPLELRRRFDALGVPSEEAPLEKVFPRSGRARDVRDALEREARAAGVRVVLDARVTGVRPGPLARDGAGSGTAAPGWHVAVEGHGPVAAPELLLCPGGRSYPGSGTTGDGYAWLRELDLPLVAPVPALVPLTSPASWVTDLSGIAWQGGEVRLVDARGKTLDRRPRPLLFTHRGLSGPAAMDLSVHVARALEAHGGEGPAPRFELVLDLFPELDREALRGLLVEAAGTSGQPRLSRALPEAPPRRLLARVAAQALGHDDPRALERVDVDPPVKRLDRAARHAWVEALKGLRLPVDGTRGYEAAEVTSGGLDLRALDPRSLRVNGHPGLRVCGELLDLDGPIGGLNFQAAFACAELAARTLLAERG